MTRDVCDVSPEKSLRLSLLSDHSALKIRLTSSLEGAENGTVVFARSGVLSLSGDRFVRKLVSARSCLLHQ